MSCTVWCVGVGVCVAVLFKALFDGWYEFVGDEVV